MDVYFVLFSIGIVLLAIACFLHIYQKENEKSEKIPKEFSVDDIIYDEKGRIRSMKIKAK